MFTLIPCQIHNEDRKFAQGSMVKSVVAYGGTSVFYQAGQLQRGCNILVATPGRWEALLGQLASLFRLI